MERSTSIELDEVMSGYISPLDTGEGRESFDTELFRNAYKNGQLNDISIELIFTML